MDGILMCGYDVLRMRFDDADAEKELLIFNIRT